MRRASCLAVGAVVLLGACSASPTPNAEPGAGEVVVTLQRVIEEILPPTDSQITFEIMMDGRHLHTATYDIEFSGTDYRTTLDTISVPAGVVEVIATLEPQGATCETSLGLVAGVEMSVSAVVRHGCFFEVIETEPWHTVGGQAVPASELEEFYGGGHCAWETVRFIAFGGYWGGDAYLRDAEGVFPPVRFVSSSGRARLALDDDDLANAANLDPAEYLTLDLDVELPDDAESLRYRRGLRELYTSPSESGDYLYVVSPDGVERWPRVLPHPACA